MEYRLKRQRLFRIVLSALTVAILLQSAIKFNISNPNDAVFYAITVLACVVMNMMGISIGKMYIDLTDSIIAFVFLSLGLERAVILQFIFWGIVYVVDENLLGHHKELPRRLLNLSMFTLATYIASYVMGFAVYIGYQYKLLGIISISVGFICIFLLVNLTILKTDISLEEGKYYKFDRESRNFLCVNLAVSIILTALLCIVHNAAGMIGTILIIANLIITHYCFYIFRKLAIRNEAIKGLLRITSDIVKYGDFRDKCKHLLISLNQLIPYTICAIYTFDINNDSVSFPVAYNGGSIIDIGELGMHLSSGAVTAKIVKEGRLYISKDIKRDKKIRIDGKLAEVANAMVLVPIVIADKVEGLILIGGNQALVDFVYNGIEEMLNILSNQMALAIENDIFYRSIKNKAEIDPLTKLYNRRVFNREVEKLINTNTNFSLVMYDLDDFKKINDTYGHLVGDEVLENISEVITKSIRKTDVPCRYGGEEIAIIFKDLSKEDAYIISDRIREIIESTAIHSGIGDIHVTISGGIASYPEDGETKEEIIGNADNVLYAECKRKGKNKIYTYKDKQRHAVFQ